MIERGASDPPAKVSIGVTERQRELILTHTLVYDELREKLRSAAAKRGAVGFSLTLDELDDLAGYVAAEGLRSGDEGLEREFGELHAYLSRELELCCAEELATEDDPPELPDLPGGVREEIAALFREGKVKTIEEANAELDRLCQAYNHRPQAQFGGLSPYQITRLIYSDWDDPSSAIRVNEDLPFSELKDIDFLVDVRTFLQTMVDMEKVKATVGGNLNRKFVMEMLDKLRWPPGFVEDILGICKAINEPDLMMLNVLRIVAELARLVRRTKGYWHVTKKGRALLDESAAGRLYALLFKTHFQRFNIAYWDRVAECPEVQETIGFCLYAVGAHAADWQTPEALTPKLFLPMVQERIPEDVYSSDDDNWMVESRILGPLEGFGLIECQYAPGRRLYYQKRQQVRKTALFDAFLSFDLD